MSVESIVGLIASIFTIGETVKTNVPLINRFSKKRKINLDNWKSDDIVTQARLDEFKSKLPAQYKEKIFTEEEINSIIKDFFDEKKNATITESEKETLEFNIRDIFSKYNEYTLSQMSPGEKVILHRIEDSQSKTNKKLDQLLSQNNDENEKKLKKATEISKSIKLNNILNILLFYLLPMGWIHNIEHFTTPVVIMLAICAVLYIVNSFLFYKKYQQFIKALSSEDEDEKKLL